MSRGKGERLTEAQHETLTELSRYGLSGWCNAYDMALYLFGEGYGIFASRARGRLMALKRLGLAENNSSGGWRITDLGRRSIWRAG